MLFPKKAKHRKWQSARSSEKKTNRPETKGLNVDFGSYGLKATTEKRITSNQIEAARRAMVRYGGKTAKFWTRIFPDRPFTQKGAQVPMGKGKGDPKGYQASVRPGRIIFEIDGVTEEVAKEALRKAGTKLKLVKK